MDYLHSCDEGGRIVRLIIVGSLLDVLCYRVTVESESRKGKEHEDSRGIIRFLEEMVLHGNNPARSCLFGGVILECNSVI